MPRKAKPQQIAPGATEYGTRQDLEASMQQMPLAQADPMATHQAAVGAAMNVPPPPPGGLLRQPPPPNEPLTAGLSTGPGPGPEVISGMSARQAQVQRQLKLAAEISGNPKLAEMAARSNRPIGRQLPRGAPRR